METTDAFVRQLSALTSVRRKEEGTLRPSKYLLRLLHLTREHAAAVAFRPISYENETYLLGRIKELKTLQQKLKKLYPDVKTNWKKSVLNLGMVIEKATQEPRQSFFAEIVRICDRTGYKSYWDNEITYIPFSDQEVLKKPIKEIQFVFGPALGLGDEITAVAFSRSIKNHFPEAKHVFNSFYPAFWKTQFPDCEIHQLEGAPDAILDKIEALRVLGALSETLVVFINFSGIEYYKMFCLDKRAPVVLELAIGKGKMWLGSGFGKPVQVLETLDPILPNNYMALRNMVKQMGLPVIPPPGTVVKRKENSPFVLTVNPFTSKKILLGPGDWVKVISLAMKNVQATKGVWIQIMPGMTAKSAAYANQMKSRLTAMARGKIQIVVLNEGKPLHASTAMYTAYAAIKKSSLMLGIDTFSAHLANLLGTPSLAICYGRNMAFWADAPGSIWMEIHEKAEVVADMVKLMIQLILDRDNPLAKARIPVKKAMVTKFVQAYRVYQHGDGNENSLKCILEAGNQLWASFPKALQEHLIELDKNYNWNKISNGLSDLKKVDREWMKNMLVYLHFTKVALFLNPQSASDE